VPQDTLDDLKERLARTRWTDTLDRDSWEHGVSLAYLQSLVGYWETAYDWRGQEDALNEWPHFALTIEGLRLHFVHVRSAGPSAIPIVLTHGWPGSFFEMLKLVRALQGVRNGGHVRPWSFDVVIPSIPGFGFSDRPTRRGMNAWKVADLWAALMTALGYDRFVAQGGDFGASVSTALALRHSERLLGLHLNYIPGSYRPFVTDDTPPTPIEQEFLRDSAAWFDREGAYAHLQATKPQTLGVALNDSPSGLAAWLVEKYRAWSDCDGDITRRFTQDEILTHVMLYWITSTIHSSARFYAETRSAPLAFGPTDFVGAPVGIARFPREAPFPPRAWIARGYNIVQWSDMPSGGHFAAMEEPDALAEDIVRFVTALEVV
jgi:pimeloyl-ACP methyl ester carboxylesterase